MKKKLFTIIATYFLFGNLFAQVNIEYRIEALLKQMTLEEKIGQKNQLHCEDWNKLKEEIEKGYQY